MLGVHLNSCSAFVERYALPAGVVLVATQSRDTAIITLSTSVVSKIIFADIESKQFRGILNRFFKASIAGALLCIGTPMRYNLVANSCSNIHSDSFQCDIAMMLSFVNYPMAALGCVMLENAMK